MAEIKKYTEEEKARLAPLETEAKKAIEKSEKKKEEETTAKKELTLTKEERTFIRDEEKAVISEKQKTEKYKEERSISNLLTDAAVKKYNKKYEDLTRREKEDLIKSTESHIDQKNLTDLNIYQPAESTSIQDVIDILEKREVVPAMKIVNFNLNYSIEYIRKPDSNKIYSLSTTYKNILNKPTFILSDGIRKKEPQYKLKNFMTQQGGLVEFVVGGAPDSRYQLQVYNETDNTYYDWDFNTEIFESKVRNTKSEKMGAIIKSDGRFRTGFTSFHGIIPENGKDIIPVRIPASSQENLYKIRFVQFDIKDGLVDYGLLPVYIHGGKNNLLGNYVINQLPNITTTIKMDTNSGHDRYSGEKVITHTPGALLNKSSGGGDYDITLYVYSREKLKVASNVLGGIVNSTRIKSQFGEYDSNQIIDTDLLASVEDDGLTGKITGTITLGKSSIRESEILFDIRSIFQTI